MKIRLSTALYMIVCAICMFVIGVLYKKTDSSAFAVYSTVLLIETVAFMWSNKKNSGSVLNFSTIFMIVLLIFNFGQVFLLGYFEWSLVEKTVALKFFTTDELLPALRWMNGAYVLIGAGCLVVTKTRNIQPVANPGERIDNSNTDMLISRALTLLAVSLPIKLFIDANFLLRAMTAGFDQGKAWLNTFPSFITTIGNFSVIAVAYLIVLYKRMPRKQMGIFITAIVYICILMLSGRRSENVSYICIITMLFAMSRKTKKTNILKVAVWAVFGYVLILLLYTVVRSRANTGNSLAFILRQMARYNAEENVLLETMREYGQTGYTAVCVLVNWLETQSPSWGSSYLLGISSVFPNIGGMMGQLTEKSNFGLTLLHTIGMLDPRYLNIGGNIIGEVFFNFGKVGGLILMPLLGAFVGKINNGLIKNIKEEKYALIYWIPLMFATLYWVRDYFGDSVRDMVWGIGACYAAAKIKLKIKGA